jgi:hypothetical protein
LLEDRDYCPLGLGAILCPFWCCCGHLYGVCSVWLMCMYVCFILSW